VQHGTKREDSDSDRPFAETKEQLGGSYTVEAKGLQEATAIAGIPGARSGSIEVREIERKHLDHSASTS